jgi:3'-phosphoadenosine 5'-phosphosulfate sulfotransferase (PAPS reductase)/FAD synthetase
MVLRLISERWPLDEIVFFDTGWEFPQMYDHIAKFEAFTGRKVTAVHSPQPFSFWMFDCRVKASKGPQKGQVHRIGNGWPSPVRRWCTRQKVRAIERHNKGAHQYVGIAADEAHRMATGYLSRSNVSFPLVEWEMDEADCLAYCRERGFDWGGLYNHFTRVSCFCCPLQRLSNLRKLRMYHPDLWATMLEWDSRVPAHNRGFRGYDTVADLERRFAQEDRQGTFPSMANAEGQPRREAT